MTTQAPAIQAVTSPGKVLAGFFLCGFLFALLGAILPAWGYYRDPPEFVTVGNYFLCMTVAVVGSVAAADRVLKRGVTFLLVFACSLACAGLVYLALVGPLWHAAWRMAGVFIVGVAAGLLTKGLFHAVSACYRQDPARTVVRGGILYGLGCLAVTLLVAGTFNLYTVPSIVLFMAVVPGMFAGVYAKTEIPAAAFDKQPGVRQALRDFRSPGAVLFALLLFFQFGNEWALASWLPLFLVRRLGISPKASLVLLALYWTALLGGRVGAVYLLGRVRHGRLLMGSVLAAIFGMFLLFFTNNAFGAGTGAVVVGCGFASIYPLVAEKIGHRFPYFHPGFFNGIFSLAMMGAMLAPATLGYFAAFWDIGVVMALPLLGTWMVLALLLLIWLEAKVTGR